MSQSQELITSDDKTPLVQVLTWMFLTVSILSVVARIATKLSMVGKLRLDDYLAVVSAVAAGGQSAAVLVQCANGFGKHMEALSESQISALLKSEYAANALFIISLFFAKLSVIDFVRSIARLYKRTILGLEIFLLLWAVSAVVVGLFQCHVPRPWSYIGNACVNRVAFWTYFSTANILTDCALIALMIFISWRMQTSWAKRILVMGVFGSRIFVVPAVICQIYYSYKSMNSSDSTFDMWPAVITIQIVQCLSIVTACIPYLKPFLDSLESGQMRSDDLRRRGKTGVSGYGGTGSNSSSGPRSFNRRPSIKPNTVEVAGSVSSRQSMVQELASLHSPKRPTIKMVGGDRGLNWDEQSHTSQSVLIQQTRTWDVDVEVVGQAR